MSVTLLAGAGSASAEAPTFTTAPAATDGSSCFPFQIGTGWTPYAAFIYQNIPAFTLRTGDVLAFDSINDNDNEIRLEISLAPTTVNGGDVPGQAFQSVVSNATQPAGAPGNFVTGDFDLRFSVGSTFTFPGGGLIIRFSSPAGSHATDNTCNGGVDTAATGDASGFFVRRAFGDADGTAPWSGGSPNNAIGGFRIDRSGPCRGKAATIVGTDGDDQLQGTAGPDVISTFAGNDRVNGLAGDDTVCGGDGKDRVIGNQGKDLLSGEAGKDRLSGSSGKDRLLGGAGKDVIRGGPGKDKIVGGAGKDNTLQ